MATWSAAVLVAAVVALAGIPALRGWAFESGWFERRTETQRSRAERRPTHGGLVLGVATLAGGVLGGPDEKPFLAAAVALVIAVATGRAAERGKGSPRLILVGRLAGAAALPALGIRAELTGGTVVDVLLTVAGALLVVRALDALEGCEGAVPAVAGVAAAGLLAAAVAIDDPSAPMLGALVGACVGGAAHAWPPAAVRMARIGPLVLGIALTASAIELDPETSAPRSALVPVLALALIGVAAVVPHLDRRLYGRGLAAHLVLPIAGIPGAYAAYALSRGDLELLPALAVGLGPAALVAAIGVLSPDRSAEVRPRGRFVLAGLGAVVLLGAAAAFAALSLKSARDDMEAGREAAVDALATARSGDLDGAEARFRLADEHFDDARGRLGNVVVRLGDLVPGIAQNLRGARTLAEVGSDLTDTAVAVAQRAGANDLRVVDGAFPIDAARDVALRLGAARATLESAVDRLGDVDSPYLYDALRDGLVQVRQEVAQARESIIVAAEATRLVPRLLGAEREGRWLVGILSSSELRGAGGLLGDFAELSTKDGRIDLVRTISAAQMNRANDPQELREVLPPVYTDTYGTFAVPRFWQNLSVTPDVPTMARTMAAAFPLTDGGVPLDGVIAIDPVGLASLLEVTGPVRVPLWPVPLTSENIVDVLLFDHYQRLEGEARESFQSLVVAAVVDALGNGRLDAPSRLAAAMAPAVQGGHLRLWGANTDVEALFERIGADGALRPDPRGDFVQLVTQNGSESKIDWFLRRSLRYEAQVDPATGELVATATVELRNLAPSSGVDSYIIGEDEADSPTRPGESRIWLSLLTPHLPLGVSDGAGNALGFSIGQEEGDLVAITMLVRVPPGGSQTIRYQLSGAVPPGVNYQVTVGNQPKRVPDAVEVAVRPVEGWKVTSRGQGAASFDGDRVRDVEIRFAER